VLGPELRRLAIVLFDEQDAPFEAALTLLDHMEPESVMVVSVACRHPGRRVLDPELRYARARLEARARCTLHCVASPVESEAPHCASLGETALLLGCDWQSAPGCGLDRLAQGSHALVTTQPSPLDGGEWLPEPLRAIAQSTLAFMVHRGGLDPSAREQTLVALARSGLRPGSFACQPGETAEPPRILTAWACEPSLPASNAAPSRVACNTVALWQHAGARLAPFFPGEPSFAEESALDAPRA